MKQDSDDSRGPQKHLSVRASPKMRGKWLGVVLLAAILPRLFFAVIPADGGSAFLNRTRTLHVQLLRSSFLMILGEGYSQVDPRTPTAEELKSFIAETLRSGWSNDRTMTLDQRDLFPETLHPPGYSLLMVPVILWQAQHLYIILAVFGALLDTLACVLVAMLAGRLFGERAGLLTGLAYALFPPLWWNAVLFQPLQLMPLCFVLLAILLQRWMAAENARRGYEMLALASLLGGAFSLLRPDILLAVPATVVGVRLFRRQLVGLFEAPLALVLCLLPLTPWAFYTRGEIGRPVFTSTSFAVTMVSGLAQLPNPWHLGPSDDDRDAESREATGFHAFDPRADGFFSRRVRQYLREHPGHYLKVVAYRMGLNLVAPYVSGLNLKQGFSFAESQNRGLRGTRLADLVGRYADRLVFGVFNLCLVGFTGWAWIGSFRKGAVSDGLLLLSIIHAYNVVIHALIYSLPKYILPTEWCLLAIACWVLASRMRASSPGGACA